MTTNLDCAVAVLEKHREARMWADAAVAADLLEQLGIDPAGEAVHAAEVVEPVAEPVAEVDAPALSPSADPLAS